MQHQLKEVNVKRLPVGCGRVALCVAPLCGRNIQNKDAHLTRGTSVDPVRPFTSIQVKICWGNSCTLADVLGPSEPIAAPLWLWFHFLAIVAACYSLHTGRRLLKVKLSFAAEKIHWNKWTTLEQNCDKRWRQCLMYIHEPANRWACCASFFFLIRHSAAANWILSCCRHRVLPSVVTTASSFYRHVRL